MTKFNYLQKQLDDISQNNLLRTLKTVDTAQGPSVKIAGKTCLLFASNNYLNLASSEKIKKAVHCAVDDYGTGAGASRLISGTMAVHSQAERALAEFTHKQSALLFPSGWTANEAVIKTIAQKGDLLIIDKLSHASIIDAVRAGDADFRTFRTGDFDRVEKLLASGKYGRRFLVTESIFSMDGNCADLKKLVELKKKYNAYLIVDEAHSFGCMGSRGAGLAEELGVLEDVDIFIATMSKAMACTGAVVASDKVVIDYLINKARAFIYTTSPMPVMPAAVIAGLEVIKSEPARRAKLRAIADYLRDKLVKLGLNIGSSTTYIVPVVIGQEAKTLSIAQKLLDDGFYVPAIRPPTVAKGSSRLRISLQVGHSLEDIDRLVDALERYCI